MGMDLFSITNILTSPPGDLIYHLVVNLALALTFVWALSKRVSNSRHVFIGSSILLLNQMALFGLRFLSNEITARLFLVYPFIEHLIFALTVIWLVWTFVESDKSFILTGIIIFLSLALILFGIVTNSIYNFLPPLSIEGINIFLIIWQVGILLLILLGLIFILIQRPRQWQVAMLMLIVLTTGQIAQITMLNIENFRMGAVRLALTLSLPWVVVLVQRFGPNKKNVVIMDEAPAEINPASTVDTKPLLMDYLFRIPLQVTQQEKFKAVARALSLSIVADVCYLIRLSDENNLIQVIGGYDLIREEFLPTTAFPPEDLAQTLAAWKNNQIAIFSQADSDKPDTATLISLLQYHRIGHILAYPLTLPKNNLVGGIIFMSPYTNKRWGIKTITLLDEIRDTLAQVLFLEDQRAIIIADLERAEETIRIFSKELEQITDRLAEKESEVNNQIAIIKQLKAKYQIEKLETVKEIEGLKTKIRGLSSRTALDETSSSKLELLNMKIRQLTNENDQLETALSRANARIRDLETQTGQTGPIRLSMDKQIISLDSIAANVRLRIAPRIQQKMIDLEIINPDGRQMIKTDPELLQTVLVELLNNAIEASGKNGTVQLSQKLSLETGMLVIQVTDFGEGLTTEEQTALFSADHQSVSGIGNVKSIREAIRAIRVLNGKIWLRSKKEAFTTFRVQLPVRIID